MDIKFFLNKSEDFVAEWLQENGLMKLVDIFKDMCTFLNQIFYNERVARVFKKSLSSDYQIKYI